MVYIFYDTDTNYYSIELEVKDIYYRGVWGDGLNIVQDHNFDRDTVVIAVYPEVNQAPIAGLLVEMGDYDESCIGNPSNNGLLASNPCVDYSFEYNEQLFDIAPKNVFEFNNFIDQQWGGLGAVLPIDQIKLSGNVPPLNLSLISFGSHGCLPSG